MTTSWIDHWAKVSPTRIAFEDGDLGTTYDYKSSAKIVDHLANFFSETFQVEKGDRIAVVATNYTEYVFLLFAAQKLGALLVPVNFRLTSHEFSHIFEDCTPKVIICEDFFQEAVTSSGNWPTLHFSDYLEEVHKGKTASTPFISRAEFESPCMILYTSGTTGRPKGAVLTNKGLFWNSVNTFLRLDLQQSDITVTFAPFFHTGGWNVLTTPFVHKGAHTVFTKDFNAEKVLQLLSEKKATLFFGVPTTLDMLSQQPSFPDTDLSSIRYALVGGEPMPLELIRLWQKRDVPIRQGYGLTEFGPNVFSLNEEHAIEKIGSVGFANFYVETQVVNANGTPCAAGEIGELSLRGPMCMKEYWNNPAATEKTIRNGWLHTGDLVKFDEDGFFYVVGREKDMFISGGENVYPAEVERVIRSLDGIREAAVIGVPDEKWGEVGKAFVSLDKELETELLKRHCLGHLAKFKVPKYFEILEELPKGDSGKIDKKQLTQLVDSI